MYPAAARATARILASFPQAEKVGEEYMAALTECLAHLTADELALVNDPRNGLATTTKFLPTPGDVHEFLRNQRAKAEQFKSHPTSGYKRLMDHTPDPRPPTLEERKAIVMRELGYDPQRKGQPAARGPLVPPTADDLEQIRAKSKIPDAPISDALKNWLRETGYAETLRSQGKPVPVWLQEDANV